MSAALGLLRLQQVDSRIDQLKDKLERIRVEMENDSELAGARQGLEIAEFARQEMERNRLDIETQARSQRSKMQQAESTLYSGSVQNPKELQDLQADVASLKRHLAVLEDTEFDCMVKLETAESVCLDAQRKFNEVHDRTNNQKKQLSGQQTNLERALQNLEAERMAAVSAMSTSLLDTYEALRRSRRGIAVAEVSDHACSACGTGLTAALQQSARHATDIVYCPSCNRILYGG